MQNKLDEALLDSVFGKADEDIPPANVPEALPQKLYGICNKNKVIKKPFFTRSLVASIAASMFVALTLNFYFESNRREQQALQAKQELLVAFEYMGRANASVVHHIERPLVEASLLQVVDVLIDRR